MDQHVAALVLEEIAALLTLRGADRFRVRAYRRAAAAVGGLEGDLAVHLAQGRLGAVPGLGPVTIEALREVVETGGSRLLERLRSETPAEAVLLRRVSGIGPKRLRALHEALGIETLQDLRGAARAGRLSGVPGLGPATERRILAGIDFVDRSLGRRRRPEAIATASRLIGHLRRLPAERIVVAGALRRGCETIGVIDLLAVTADCHVVIQGFVAIPALTDPHRVDGARHEDQSSCEARAVMADGVAVRLRCVPKEQAGAAWLLSTGSEAHVAAVQARAVSRGLRLDARGLRSGATLLAAEDEASIYATLDMAWVPPELREGRGEVEAAAAGRLPRLVEDRDLRGTFHCHTTFSDGTATVHEMAAAALEHGWRYLGIADHSITAAYAGGLTVDDVRRQHAEIDDWNGARGAELRLFKGIESDILPDGRLDYDAETLDSFQYVVGSVHSALHMSRDAMTARMRAALTDPRLTILGHPTGRLLLRRGPYALDLEAVLDAASRTGAAVEINADPARLDLDWRHWPAAKALGIPCAIDPDAHSPAGLGAVAHGVVMARKGWLEPADVINTRAADDIEAWLRARRAGVR